LFLFAAGAPSSLYAVYETRWHYSPATTTVVFGVYALALLASLLVFGDLSDAIGRKPVVVLALGLLAVSLVLFASGVGWLYAARAVQGIATGLLTASVSAALIDTEPARRPGLTGLVSSAAAMGGQGAVSWSRQSWSSTRRPTRLIYLLLLVATVALAFATLRGVEETVPSRRRPRFSVRLGIATDVRPVFFAAVPCWSPRGPSAACTCPWEQSAAPLFRRVGERGERRWYRRRQSCRAPGRSLVAEQEAEPIVEQVQPFLTAFFRHTSRDPTDRQREQRAALGVENVVEVVTTARSLPGVGPTVGCWAPRQSPSAPPANGREDLVADLGLSMTRLKVGEIVAGSAAR